MHSRHISQSRPRYHVANLINFSGVILARYTAELQLHAAVAGACRMRFDANEDHVYALQPEQLANFTPVVVGEGDDRHTEVASVEPEVTVLEGDQRRGRYRAVLQDYLPYTEVFEALTPGGRWISLTFGRAKTQPNFETLEMGVSAATWGMMGDGSRGLGSTLKFAASAGPTADDNSMPTAWWLLKTMAFCIGGIDCDCFPTVTQSAAAPTLVAMQTKEREFRTNREREFQMRRLHQRIGSFSPEQRAALDKVIAAKAASLSLGV